MVSLCVIVCVYSYACIFSYDKIMYFLMLYKLYIIIGFIMSPGNSVKDTTVWISNQVSPSLFEQQLWLAIYRWTQKYVYL